MVRCALILLVAASAARAAEAPRCRDGKAPTFTGRPFDPVTCAAEPASPAVELSTTSLPSFDEKHAADGTLDALVGKWEGTALFSGDRFDVLLVVAKAGRGYKLRFESREYRFLAKHALEAGLKGKFWGGNKGRYAATVKADELPSAPRQATVFVGRPLAPDARGYDREVALVYDGRADSHRVRFEAGKDALRYRYDYAGPKPLSFSGELRPSKKESL